jgi:hypothetical protein
MGKMTAAVVLVVAVTAIAAAAVLRGGSRDAAHAQRANRDAVKVHGEWTIEVRTKTGAVVERRRFHNDLVPGGASALSQFLGRGKTVGRWQISMPPAGVCGAFFCNIREPGAALGVLPPADTGQDLTVSIPPTGVDAGKLVLHGTVAATSVGAVTSVNTLVQECSLADGTGADCAPMGYVTFSARVLGTPIAVQPTQQIAATVRFSFS